MSDSSEAVRCNQDRIMTETPRAFKLFGLREIEETGAAQRDGCRIPTRSVRMSKEERHLADRTGESIYIIPLTFVVSLPSLCARTRARVRVSYQKSAHLLMSTYSSTKTVSNPQFLLYPRQHDVFKQCKPDPAAGRRRLGPRNSGNLCGILRPERHSSGLLYRVPSALP